MTTNDLPKCLHKHAEKISSVSDERGSGDGYWVYLAPGWRDPDGETHCLHEDNPSQCAKLMKWIQPCTTPGCCS